MANTNRVTVDQLQTVVNGLASKVNTTFEKKESLKALAYLDEIPEAMVTKHVAASSAITTINTAIDNLQADKADKTELDDYAKKTDVASTYKASGSKTATFITTAPTSATLGNVYNMSEEFTTNVNFVEGAGKKYPAGTNIAVVEIPGATDSDPKTYKFDVMAGFIDTSEFLTEDDIPMATDADIQAIIDGVAFSD